MRKLASIQKISKLEPIKGADRIEEAIVLGWHVVVKKGLYKEGDRVVYLEIDSILPKDLAERAGFKDTYLKTRRFKGVYSQGMCIPLAELCSTKFPKGNCDENTITKKAADGRWDGTNVTDYLGITKHEADIRNNEQWWKRQQHQAAPKKWYMKFKIGRWFWTKFLYKPASGPFPTHLVPKTDETRCQVLSDVLERYEGVACEYTEKLDGSSITFYLDKKGKLHVCSRNREIYDKKDFMYIAASEIADRLTKEFVYQGEILGPNIQGNKYGVRDCHIFVYQVFDTVTKQYLAPHALTDHLKRRGINQVPVLGEFNLTANIDKLVDMAKGMSTLVLRMKDTKREGIVVRPLRNIEENDDRFVGSRLSFKVINPEFLVKYKI